MKSKLLSLIASTVTIVSISANMVWLNNSLNEIILSKAFQSSFIVDMFPSLESYQGLENRIEKPSFVIDPNTQTLYWIQEDTQTSSTMSQESLVLALDTQTSATQNTNQSNSWNLTSGEDVRTSATQKNTVGEVSVNAYNEDSTTSATRQTSQLATGGNEYGEDTQTSATHGEDDDEDDDDHDDDEGYEHYDHDHTVEEGQTLVYRDEDDEDDEHDDDDE